MFPLSKRWMMVSALGHGVLFSLALTGLVRIVCYFRGVSLPESVAGNLFLISSLLTGAIAALVYARYLKHRSPTTDLPGPIDE